MPSLLDNFMEDITKIIKVRGDSGLNKLTGLLFRKFKKNLKFSAGDIEAVIGFLKDSKQYRETLRESVSSVIGTMEDPYDLLAGADDLIAIADHLGDAGKYAISNMDTVFRMITKTAIAWTNYAVDESTWKEIGYKGPRGVPFVPPKDIIENNIVMTKALCNPAHKIGMVFSFSNKDYEKQMKEKNRLLRDNIRDIKEYQKNYNPDVIIIGTGAGGAAVAHVLSRSLNKKKILILESGGLHTSSNFNQLERKMIPALYPKTGPRFSDDFGVAIIQGNLIGGSATLNHAVCYEAPREVTSGWDFDLAGVLKDGGYYKRVEDMIHYDVVKPFSINKNAQLFQAGIEKIHGKAAKDIKELHYNVRNTNAKLEPGGKAGARWHELTCTGCGFCVLGCSYDRKQTPLVTYIPATLQNSVDGAGGNEVRIFKNARVSEVLSEGGKVTGVRLNGCLPGIGDLTIKAKTVIVSAGAISSAQLLLKSNIKDPFLGKNISLHPSPLIYGVFKSGAKSKVYSDWGIPMSASYHRYQFPKASDKFPDKFGYVLETIYNHPASTAATFSLSTMKKRMKQYEKIANISVILHDKPVGVINKGHGQITSLTYKLDEDDKFKLRHAIKTGARILLEAGADEVFTNHEDELVFRDRKDLRLTAANCPIEPGKILLATGHPQGGCGMGKKGNGFADFSGESYKVKNLYVCDASLFPTSLGVNPQLTIMAMAEMIGDKIAENLA